eukprot:jgi/Ulvmu1/1672/UM115_0001.1
MQHGPTRDQSASTLHGGQNIFPPAGQSTEQDVGRQAAQETCQVYIKPLCQPKTSKADLSAMAANLLTLKSKIN